MNFLESLLYGFLSGLTEILPVSSQAHQTILLHLFGAADNGLLRLFVHAGMLIAVLISFRSQMIRLYREMRLAELPKKRRRRAPDPMAVMDVSFLKTAGWALLLSFLVYPPAAQLNGRLNYVALFLFINGVILYIPQLLSTGNKDARTMSPVDSVLIGLSGALGMLPGVSAIGTMMGICSIRGGDRQKSFIWSCFLLVPMLTCLIGFDIQQIVQNGTGALGFGGLAACVLSGAAAFLGAALSIRTLRFVVINAGLSAFAFYSWGAALFAFIMYLT